MVVVVNFNYLPRGLTGNKRTGRGTRRATGYTRMAGNRGPAEIEGGTEDFGSGVYTGDPVTDSRGERENESC